MRAPELEKIYPEYCMIALMPDNCEKNIMMAPTQEAFLYMGSVRT